jgi:hypothetical protein
LALWAQASERKIAVADISFKPISRSSYNIPLSRPIR